MNATVVQQAQLSVLHVPVSVDSVPSVHYRSLQPADLEELKAIHAALFPIDYDESFFHRASHGLDRIWSCAAVSTDPCGAQQLLGFIIAKSVFLHEVDASDRQHMGLLSAVLDHDRVLYIMTLGVVEGQRHRGIASTLIAIACRHAFEARCRAVFLHVITYNTAAMSLYARQGFNCVARLRGFYFITTGRTPDPEQQVYDAFLFVQYVVGTTGVPSPWDLVSLAWSPLRLAFNRLLPACMPGFCRSDHVAQQAQHQALLAPPQAQVLDESGCNGRDQQHGLPGGYGQQQQQPDQHRHQQGQHHHHHLHRHQHLLHHHHQQQQQQWHGLPDGHSSHQHRGLISAGRQQHRRLKLLVRPSQQRQPQPQQLPPPPPSPLQQQQQLFELHQGMHPPQQRMLRWLFNGASRDSSAAVQLHRPTQPQQQQQHEPPPGTQQWQWQAEQVLKQG